MSDQPGEKKIIIDEDWKSQVQAEKEAAKEAPESPVEESVADGANYATKDVPLPPASLEILIGSLATQAMVALGILPNPVTNTRTPLPNQAKHLVDTLAVLQEKTEGNRTAEESAMLDDALHQLRMAYVAVLQSVKK